MIPIGQDAPSWGALTSKSPPDNSQFLFLTTTFPLYSWFVLRHSNTVFSIAHRTISSESIFSSQSHMSHKVCNEDFQHFFREIRTKLFLCVASFASSWTGPVCCARFLNPFPGLIHGILPTSKSAKQICGSSSQTQKMTNLQDKMTLEW